MSALVDFFLPPKGANLWTAINAPIVVAVAAALFAWLLKDRVQEIVQDFNQTRTLEEQPEPEPQPPEPELAQEIAEIEETVPFSQASQLIDGFKKFVDRKANGAPDGRNRRKYNNFQRYNYVPIVKALVADRNIDDTLGSLLIDSFEKWRTYRTGRVPVPAQLVNSFEQVQARINQAQGV